MAQYFEVHPDNPQPRLLKQGAALLKQGAVLAVPTDSSYALVCRTDDKTAVDRLRRIRQVDEKHHLTLLCRDLSEPGQLRPRGQPAVPPAQAGHARPIPSS